MIIRRVLAEVGVSAEAETAYQFLLAEPGATATQIRNGTRLSPHHLSLALDELERGALVSRRSETPARFQPAPPDMAVEALISAREEALHQTRLDAQHLQTLRKISADQTQITELIEVLTSRESYEQRWNQLQITARRTLEVFVRPPFAQSRIEDSDAPQTTLIGKGVVSRAIYDAAALQAPGMLEHVRRMSGHGEQVRVVSELPMKLSLADRSTALVPFVQFDPAATVDAGLEVHRSPLLDALVKLFDLYWELGTPLAFDGDQTKLQDSSREATESTVLTLMAAGWKDDAIAGKLGVSTQTVRRRITALQQRLGVATRFQAGLRLGRSGWPDAQRATAKRPATTGAQQQEDGRRRPPDERAG